MYGERKRAKTENELGVYLSDWRETEFQMNHWVCHNHQHYIYITINDQNNINIFFFFGKADAKALVHHYCVFIYIIGLCSKSVQYNLVFHFHRESTSLSAFFFKSNGNPTLKHFCQIFLLVHSLFQALFLDCFHGSQLADSGYPYF